MFKENATFHCWKASGKWYATGRGHFPEAAFQFQGQFESGGRLAAILSHNQGRWPGLNSAGTELIRVVIADERVDYGWPLIFKPEKLQIYKEE